ncbi:putative integral membrane protein [Acanthocheilonema viteae]
MVNYLEGAQALAECSPSPSLNISPIQQQKPERFSKVNFIDNPQRDNTIGYKQVEDIIEENNHCMKHKIRFSNASAQLSQYRCCCSLMHAATGTRLFLLIYVALSVITCTFAIKSAMLWSAVPLIITLLSIYALYTEKHKYLYPFLIISSVHIILCIMIVLIIITFTAASYGTFRQIVGYYIKIGLSDTFIVIFVITSVILFLTLSIMHLWQVTVVYR